MDISIFKRVYFKQDLLTIEEVFKPYSYFDLGLDKLDNEPFGGCTEKVFDNVIHNFMYGDEFDVTYDALTMNEMIGTSNKKLRHLDIEVRYQEIEGICEVNELETEFSFFLKKHEKEYLNILQQNLLAMTTNVRVGAILESELSVLSNSYAGLDELENLIDLNVIQKLLIRQYKLSYNNLFEAIKNSYTDTFPSLIQDADLVFKVAELKNSKIAINSFGNGLIMREGLVMTSNRALKFCESLVKHGFIANSTRKDTFQNLFKRDVSEKIITQVEWTGTIPQLKHLIKSLINKRIIQESSYQKKWCDTANCFYKEGLNMDNKTFSKNTDPISTSSKEQLNRIIENLTANFQKI